ncbi:hypothetical protein BO443_270023 [Burkholderia orbicola]
MWRAKKSEILFGLTGGSLPVSNGNAYTLIQLQAACASAIAVYAAVRRGRSDLPLIAR